MQKQRNDATQRVSLIAAKTGNGTQVLATLLYMRDQGDSNLRSGI